MVEINNLPYYDLPEGKFHYAEAVIVYTNEPETELSVLIAVGWDFDEETASKELLRADMDIWYYLDDIDELNQVLETKHGDGAEWRIVSLSCEQTAQTN